MFQKSISVLVNILKDLHAILGQHSWENFIFIQNRRGKKKIFKTSSQIQVCPTV
jgi:hypothetical protein